MTDLRLTHMADVRFSSVDKKTVDGQVPVQLCNYTDVYYHERIVGGSDFMEASATDEQVRTFELRRGDVLLTKDSETAEDIGVSAYVERDLPGVICGYHLALIRPRPGVDGRYLRWALSSRSCRAQLEVAATGVTRFGLRQEAVGGLAVPSWPLARQRAIADYLDAATRRIDRLVYARRETATLLEQRRRAAIDEAILCADGPQRRVRVKHLIRGLQQGWSPECEAREAEDGEWGVLKAGCANYGVFRATENKALPPEIEPDRDLEVRAGDLLVSRANTKQLLASVCIVPEVRPNLLLCDKLYRLVPSPDTDPRFLAYAPSTSDARRHIEADATGTSDSMQNISQGTIRELVIIAPLNRRTQSDIADRLDCSLAQLAVLRASTERHIALLQERRQALITAAVTGQIEIPGVAA